MHTIVVVYFFCSTVFLKKPQKRRKKPNCNNYEEAVAGLFKCSHIQQTRPRHVTCYSKAYAHYTDCA